MGATPSPASGLPGKGYSAGTFREPNNQGRLRAWPPHRKRQFPRSHPHSVPFLRNDRMTIDTELRRRLRRVEASRAAPAASSPGRRSCRSSRR